MPDHIFTCGLHLSFQETDYHLYNNNNNCKICFNFHFFFINNIFSAMGDHNESQPSTSSSYMQSSQPCHHFIFHEILLATNNFDESLVIGRGGFGKVYKGNVLNGSTISVVAIKRLDPMSSQGASEFWAEVEMLSNFRHCHVVSLFGYCKYEKEMILVYEYMPNGTLEDHLHKLGTTLSWLQRLKICIGAARGLDYLHTGTGINVGVIHRDVKSSNILLNESWAAKISDFGLSKIGPTNQSSTYVIKGTFGYLDPDYSFTGMLTRKSDVYAFGVVLLEVLCRKRAVDTSVGEEPRNLARWAQESIKEGNLKHIVDSSLKGEISPKCLKEFVLIVGRCLLSNPKQRPMMAEVVVSLNSVLTLQEKTNTSLQGAGKTVFGKMLAHDDSKLSRKHNNRSTRLKVFKVADLDRATRHFSVSLHKGSSKEVFLGWVDKNTLAPSTEGVGIAVAVKRHNEVLHEDVFAWQDLTEMTVLGGLTHPNINSLLGYCNDKQSQRFIIVYEYMHNQNLHYFLFGADHGTRLSWETRVKIMIGVARGLAYMHSLKDQVIHRNVKSSNILLDEDFNAKLGGFGSARFGPKIGDTHVSTRVIGTRGYIDPSYLSTGHLSAGSDIYSFGVVLLETLTGKGATDIYDDHNLITWVRTFLEDRSNLENIMDPHLEKNYSLEGAFACAALALRCVAEDSKDRPSSEEVLRCFGGIYAHGDSKLSSIGDCRNTSLRVFKFADLERATRHFFQDLLLSEGRSYEVFKGWVDKNTFLPSTEGVGIAVAVKRYHGLHHEQVAEVWQREVYILGWLGHPNIISLLGYCDDENDKHLIVFEYTQNQNLSHFLFGANDGEQLSWGTRVMIMIGVARALTYIHSLEYQVIHGDVKSSNILLDQNFNAKLGGFGIARFGPEFGDTHITTRPMGTFGYIDPEYISTGHLSEGSDIYGFGVVLLEILTGKLVHKDDGCNLVKWARVSQVERSVLQTVMDPRLRLNYSLEGAFGCATLALRCVANNRKDRPSSEEVLLCLEQIYLV